MVTSTHPPDATSTRADSQPPADEPSGDQGAYTGVVLIHGLGDIKRNGMLQQALNSLSYWLNHEAGFVLREEGRGRFWLRTELTDDPDPDAPASRATIELSAPMAATDSTSDDSTLRLEFREVWWAESFGLPDVGATIRWAQVQWREQAAHLLLPIGRRLGPAKTATRAPAREVSQALTYRPASNAESAASAMSPTRRAALRGALWVYDLLQYGWKVAQWLILTPLIFVLLLVMAVVRVLAIIPFLRSAIISGFTTISSYIMLHWIAEVQVYLLDYTRSSAIRGRFQREIEGFLRDPRCERLVVIAESGGTYIAYDGLTATLARPDFTDTTKPVTFISIATALRRIWLLANTDPHRMRGILPERVRGLHFWARYDPVATGPLSARSLPSLKRWDDPAQPNPEAAIRASLERCENVDVVNTDSTFTDHVGYWDNLEQVVGPVARELMRGHPAIERVVVARLATPDAVLLRRWGVAWRYLVALVGGLAAGIGVLIWAALHPAFGDAITSFLGQVDWGGVASSIFPPFKALFGNPLPQLPPNPTIQQLEQFERQQAFTYLITHDIPVQALVVGILALVLASLTLLVIGRLVAKPSPFTFPQLDADAESMGGLFILTAVGVVLVFIASLIFSSYVRQTLTFNGPSNSQSVDAFIWMLGAAELVFVVAGIVAGVAAIQQRQWGWVISGFCSLLAMVPFDPFYRAAILVVGVAGLVACLVRVNPATRRGRALVFGLVALMSVYAGIGTTLFQYNVLRTPLLGAGVGVEALMPTLSYGLWLGPAKPAARAASQSAARRFVLFLATLYMVILAVLATSTLLHGGPSSAAPNSLFSTGYLSAGFSPTLTSRGVGVASLLFVALLMVVLCLMEAAATRRLGWFVSIPVLVWGMLTGLDTLLYLGVTPSFPEGGIAVSFTLVAPALIYALWAGSPKDRRMGGWAVAPGR